MNEITCSNCGSPNPPDRRFCDECGTPLATACPNCGQANRAGARFCGNCGTALRGAPGPAAAGEAVSRPVQAAPTAERRLVSVLFADLVDFTPFSEARDAEEVRDVQARYFEQTRAVIERHGGVVEKFIGDAVMAVWGTPTAHEDDAERAVRAGLELVAAVPRVHPDLSARAGVLTGEAAVTIGATGQGMVTGDLVNTCARLQAAAAPGTVLVGGSTVRAASGIEFEPAGEQGLKGKQAPVPAWRAVRLGSGAAGRASVDALEPPFVGRDAELALLKELIHASSRERRARLIGVAGPAGIGKSRLALELQKYLAGLVDDIYWHRGRSPSYGEGISFWALGEMVRQRAGLAETDDEATTRARVAAIVADFIADDEDRRWVEPALLALLGVEPAPPGGRDVLFAAWRIFFERIAARGTTVLLFEDLQWADSGMLDFIDHLLEWSKDVSIVVLALARPELLERRPEFGSATRHFHSVPLEPLREPEMRALLAGLAPDLPESAVRAILDRADGIPLYAVETIRMLIVDGRLAPGERGYRVVGELGELAIPDSLRSLVAARLDGLAPADRALVQDAAVLGQTFTPAALAGVSGAEKSELETRLRGLVRREILHVQADPRSPERGQYSFVQSVIREVAYGTLARGERRRRHLAAARYFEALGDDELAGALASHYVSAYRASAAGDEAEAVAVQARLALRGAAERAIALGAPEQATAYLRQALEVTPDPMERAALLTRSAEAALDAGRADDGLEWGRDALAAYRSAGSILDEAVTASVLSQLLIELGQPAEAVDVLRDMLARVSDAPPATEAGLLARLSRAEMRMSQWAQAIATADRALAIAEAENADGVVAEALINKATALSFLGRWREGTAILAGAADLAERAGLPGLQLRALNNLGSSLVLDDPSRALDIIRAALDQARRVGDTPQYVWLAGTYADFAQIVGREWDDALAVLDEVLERRLTPADRSRLIGTRSLLLLARQPADPAVLAEAEALGSEITDPGWRATVHDLRGEDALMRADYETAHAELTKSWSLYSGNAPYPLDVAFSGALRSGRIDRARELASLIAEQHLSGRLGQSVIFAVRAGLAALENDVQAAVAGYRAAFDRLHDVGADYYLASMQLDAVSVLPHSAEIRARATDEARPVFERVRAIRMLELLDRALARDASTLTGATATAASRTAEPTPRPAEASPR